MSRGVQYPVVVAFRVTHEEAAEIGAALDAWYRYQSKGYGRAGKGMRASWLHKLTLAAVRGEDLPVYREDLAVNKRAIAVNKRAIELNRKRGSSGVNARPLKEAEPVRLFLKKALPKKKRGS